jgi:2'-5' RNA ligase
MIYALIHYPSINTRRIQLLRKKYDPQAGLIGPHLTLMFPVPDSVGEDRLVRHLHDVLRGVGPFPIHLRGFQKSWDGYLFLMVQEGGADMTALHGRIYTGPLADYRKQDVPFVPHLTLGAFADNEHGYAAALEEAKRLDLDYRSVLDKLHLVKVNDERTRVVWSKEFSLLS